MSVPAVGPFASVMLSPLAAAVAEKRTLTADEAAYVDRFREPYMCASTTSCVPFARLLGFAEPTRVRCAYCGRHQQPHPDGGCHSCGAPLP
jgi:hypothetical protein